MRKGYRVHGFRLSIILLLGICLLFSPCGLAREAAAENADVPAAAQLSPLGLNSFERMQPNGEYLVYVPDGGAWREAGSLSYDRFIREKEIDFSGFVNAGGAVKLRLVKQGGGAGHIDSVFLGGKLPVKVNGEEGALLHKLSVKDLDVIDVDEGGVEIDFASVGENQTLKVTARIEGLTISQIPFQFPPENTYKTIDDRAEFYTYRINSQPGRVTVDGNLEEAASLTPFFKEYVYPGSGHPSGDIYCWVMNDNQNLYVTIDVTPDNTMDGDKDYAKVYVKTAEGVKEFKVSILETRWGRPAFVYTDKVAYQHKVYEFVIPLSEIGAATGGQGEELLLAFSAYGTMAAGEYYPEISYSPESNNYLVVYEDWGFGINGQFLNSNGSPSGGEIPICNLGQKPFVAYGVNGAEYRYLVVWEDGGVIKGQLLDADNETVSGGNFVISDAGGAKSSPKAAFDSTNKRFLVVWADLRGVENDIYGQLVNIDGSLFGTISTVNFVISNGNFSQNYPAVAYDSANSKFLVVWEDYRNGNSDIYGQLVDAGGALNGGEFLVTNAVNNQTSISTAYDSGSQTYLVTWQDERNGNRDIFAQLVNDDGSMNGANFPVSTADNDQQNPCVSYDSVNSHFLVAWEDYRVWDGDIYGQILNGDGDLVGVNFAINTDGDSQTRPSAASSQDEELFMVAFETQAGGQPDIAFSLIYSNDEEAIVADKSALTFNAIRGANPAVDNVASDLNLITTGTYGSTITWVSGDAALVTDEGTVTQPTSAEGDQPVTLTATLTRGTASDTVVFNLTIIALGEPGNIERVSIDSTGTESGDESLEASISSDGRYVAFRSSASNLVADDTNGAMDIFVHDRQTNTTERVSVSSAGVQGNSGSRNPRISADGRYVAFSSGATNLVAGDTNGEEDVFIHDRNTGATERISVSSAGQEAESGSWNYYATISADGRYVAFRSTAANLVTDDTNGMADIFVRDRQENTTVRVSISSEGEESNQECYSPVISSDGRYVAFTSGATTLVPGVTDFGFFIHDLQTHETVWGGVAESSDPALSGDGRYVAFESSSSTLVAGDTNGVGDVFVLDRDSDEDSIFDEAGATSIERVSVATDGTQADLNCYGATISGEGRYVAFYTEASTLAPGDTNGNDDVYVHDRVTNVTRKLSVSITGAQGNDDSFEPSISTGVRYMAFASAATNLVAGDTNGRTDIFVCDWPEVVADSTDPIWPDGSTLTASNIGQTTLTLIWTAANDNVGVTGYRIYSDNGTQLRATVGNALTTNIAGLSPGTSYTFTIQARDAAGNWSGDSTSGPSVTATTTAAGGGGGSGDDDNDPVVIPPKPATIRGMVAGADKTTGKQIPLAEVIVTVFPTSGGGAAGSATVESDGTYEIKDLAAGDYKVKFSARVADGGKYLESWYNAKVESEADVISLAEDEVCTINATINLSQPRALDLYPYSSPKKIYVHIPAGAVKDLDGNPLQEGYRFWFSREIN